MSELPGPKGPLTTYLKAGTTPPPTSSAGSACSSDWPFLKQQCRGHRAVTPRTLALKEPGLFPQGSFCCARGSAEPRSSPTSSVWLPYPAQERRPAQNLPNSHLLTHGFSWSFRIINGLRMRLWFFSEAFHQFFSYLAPGTNAILTPVLSYSRLPGKTILLLPVLE